jgi:hypothetical protein
MDAYVYGVLRADAAEARRPLGEGEGVDGQPVEAVTRDGLAALVSDAPRVPVRANRRNLMAHSRVLQAVISDVCVLPMQFGLVMPDRSAVEDQLLGANRERLEEHLRVLGPYVELDVRALCPEHVLLQQVVHERRDIARLRGQIEGRPVESTYHESIRLGEMVAAAVADKRAETAGLILTRLERLAAAARPADPTHEQMVASVSFLVERERVPEFDAAVDALNEEMGDPDIRLRYVGPLPAHNFVDLAAEMEAHAWA